MVWLNNKTKLSEFYPSPSVSSDLNFIFHSLNFRQVQSRQAASEIIPLHLGRKKNVFCVLQQILQDQPTVCFTSCKPF